MLLSYSVPDLYTWGQHSIPDTFDICVGKASFQKQWKCPTSRENAFSWNQKNNSSERHKPSVWGNPEFPSWYHIALSTTDPCMWERKRRGEGKGEGKGEEKKKRIENFFWPHSSLLSVIMKHPQADPPETSKVPEVSEGEETMRTQIPLALCVP